MFEIDAGRVEGLATNDDGRLYVDDNIGLDQTFDPQTGTFSSTDASRFAFPDTLTSDAYGTMQPDPGESGVTRTGGSGEDGLVGTEGEDILVGRGGSDMLFGLGGSDLLEGGFGNDIIVGDGGGTTTGAADAISGGPGADVIFGGAGGDDVMVGDQGPGGGGVDVFFGGEGADTVTLGFDGGRDFWADYEAGVDRIEARALGVQREDFAERIDIFEVPDATVVAIAGNFLFLHGIAADEIGEADFNLIDLASDGDSAL